MHKTKFVLLLAAIGSLALGQLTYAGSQASQSEGSNVRDNPTVTGGVRGDGKAQSTTESVAPISSAAVETSHVIKATPGFVFWFEAYNGNAATRYIQILNSATLPANGAVPIVSIPVAATTNLSRAFRPAIWCSTGAVIANSTTQATLTIGSADNFFTVGSR